MARPVPDFDVTVVIRVRNDEERVGRVLARLAHHLRSLGQRFELLVADEASGDNTVAVATMMRPSVRELEILHVDPGEGNRRACERARGRAVVVYDVRSEAPLSALGFALERLREGADVVAVGGRYLVFRRTRAWRAFDSLDGRSSPADLERRFVKRATSLGLSCETPHARPSWRTRTGRWFVSLVAARS
jgi:glycosyltransferase involved in cell wall biosynthesis